MIVLGIVLLILGLLLHIGVLWVLGIAALLVGLVLELAGATGRSIGGRRHYW